MPKTTYRPNGINVNDRLLFNETVDEIANELKAIYGSKIFINEFCKYHRCSRDTARKVLKGIPCIKNGIDGRKKYYRSIDIARKMAENQFAYGG